MVLHGTLTKSRMVYEFDSIIDNVAIYFHISDDDTGESQVMDIPFEKFEDLGQPGHITVTIEPGDLLNENL